MKSVLVGTGVIFWVSGLRSVADTKTCKQANLLL